MSGILGMQPITLFSLVLTFGIQLIIILAWAIRWRDG